MTEKSKWSPVQPGFQFECQACGECCRGITEVLVTGTEIAYMHKYGVPIFFRKMERTVKGREKPQVAVMPTVALVEDDCQVRCFCLGDENNPNACSIYPFRPGACSRTPLVIYTSWGKPFALAEIQGFLGEKVSEEEAQMFIHVLEYEMLGKKLVAYHFFAARTVTPSGKPCPAFEHGQTWNENAIKQFLSQNNMRFEEHTLEVEACIAHYTNMFAEEFDKHFAPVDDTLSDTWITYYRARKRGWKDIVAEAGHAAKKA